MNIAQPIHVNEGKNDIYLYIYTNNNKKHLTFEYIIDNIKDRRISYLTVPYHFKDEIIKALESLL